MPTGNNIRVDNGFEEGQEIPIYYDPMLSKLVTYGKTRNEAIQLMIQAINNYKVVGVETTLPFGKFVCEHEAFTSGNFNTHFVKNYYSADAIEKAAKKEARIASLIAIKHYLEDKKRLQVITE
jgi:acetyl/propionyl-CoA carboxylase alpha subunit